MGSAAKIISAIHRLRNRLRLRTRWRAAREAFSALHPLRSKGLWGRGRRRTLDLMVYFATNRCNSRCRHCGIWEQRPTQDLPLEVFRRVLDSPATNQDTVFSLQGGEFLLHPQADDILTLHHGRRFELFTNGLLPDRVKELVDRHHPPQVKISLDGGPEAYHEIRGVDAFARVRQLARDLARKTQVHIGYTITPWNTAEDLELVRRFCLDEGFGYGISIMHDANFMDRPGELTPIPYEDEVNLSYHGPVNMAYFHGYNRWLAGEWFVPCISIFKQLIVFPNGDLPLCHQTTQLILGNLKERPLEDIWWSPDTLHKQKQFIKCNRCWNACHRNWDLKLYQPLTAALPPRLLHWWMRRGKHPTGSDIHRKLF